MASEQDLINFERIVLGAMSPEDKVRKEAELLFESAKTHPDLFLQLLVQLLCTGKDQSARAFCAVMLRQNLLKAHGELWSKASPQIKESVANNLLHLFQSEPPGYVRRKACDCIAALARCIFRGNVDQTTGRGVFADPQKAWPNLFPVVLNGCKSAESAMQESAFGLVQRLVEVAAESVLIYAEEFKGLFGTAMQNNNQPKVQLAAMQAAIAFTLSMDVDDKDESLAAANKKRKEAYTELIPLMFAVLQQALSRADEDAILAALKDLTEVASGDPTFFRKHLEAIVALIVQVVASTQMEETVRTVAMEFLVTMVEQGKGMVRKLASFAQSVIPLCFKLMWELQENKEWYDLGDDEDNEEAEKMFHLGLESVARLAEFVGGKTFVAIAWPVIEKTMLSPEWFQRQAALLVLSEMVYSCTKQLKATPGWDKIVNQCIPFVLKDPHPRVRWSAIQVLAQMAVDVAPGFQKKHHAKYMPAMIDAIDVASGNHVRVRRHAAIAIVDFLKSCEQGHLVPYVDRTLIVVLDMLKTNDPLMQIAALKTVSAVAVVSKEYFAPYYDAFMPGIIGILANAGGQQGSASSRQTRALRAQSMEAVSFIANAVGIETFGKYGQVVMELLVKHAGGQGEAFGEDKRAVVMAFQRICQCMGASFAPYLQHVIPDLLKSAAIETNPVYIDGANPGDMKKYNEENGYSVITVNVPTYGEQKIAINTALVEEKELAIDILGKYVEVLGLAYLPYVEETIKVMVPIVEANPNDNLRLLALNTCPDLLTVFNDALVKQNMPDMQRREAVRTVWNKMCAAFMTCCDTLDQDILKDVIDGIARGVAALDFAVSNDELKIIVDMMASVVTESNARRAKREVATKSEDYDDEEAERLEGENEMEDDLLAAVQHLHTSFMEGPTMPVYVDAFMALLHKYMWPLVGDGTTDQMKVVGLCTYNVLLEAGGDKTRAFAGEVAKYNVLYAKHKASTVRHAATWGVGVCAKVMGPDFAPYINQAFHLLMEVINAPGAREDEDDGLPCDTAIAAFGLIMQHQGFCATPVIAPADVQKLAPMWLQWLPLRMDDEEACKAHALLLSMCEAKNPVIIGGDTMANLPRIFDIFGQVLDQDPELVTTETAAKIRQLWANMPGPLRDQIGASIHPASVTRLNKTN